MFKVIYIADTVEKIFVVCALVTSENRLDLFFFFIFLLDHCPAGSDHNKD